MPGKKSKKEDKPMQRFFNGLVCFSVLLMFYGCATITEDSSASGQKPVSQTEATVAAPTPGTTGTSTVQATPGTRPPGPAVEVAEASFDFGVMREDKDYSHAFVIRNAGTSELIIKKVQPG